MLPDIKDYNPKDVTINNFHESIFYSNVFFSDYLQNYYFTFHSLNEGNVEILKTLEVLLKKNVSAINGSELEKKYETPVLPTDCSRLNLDDINNIFGKILYEFPIETLNITFPKWVDGLNSEHWLKAELYKEIKEAFANISGYRCGGSWY